MKKRILEQADRLKVWLDGMEDQSKRSKRGRERNQPIQLQEETLKRLELIASKKNMSLQSALEQSVQLFCKHQGESFRRMSEERKERNPLLRLEGLLSKSHSAIKEEKEHA